MDDGSYITGKEQAHHILKLESVKPALKFYGSDSVIFHPMSTNIVPNQQDLSVFISSSSPAREFFDHRGKDVRAYPAGVMVVVVYMEMVLWIEGAVKTPRSFQLSN